MLVPQTLRERRRLVRLSEQPLSEAEQQRVAREVAAALTMPSHHKQQSAPWVDPYDDRVVLEEYAHWLTVELERTNRALAGATRADVDRFNPDDREQDREDARLREAAQDEAASKERVL